MKKTYLLFFLVAFYNPTFAQNKSTENADNLFNTYQYVSAIEAYLKLAEGKNANSYIYTKLADSYNAIFNPEEASKWYFKALESKSKLSPEVYYNYAQSLKSLGKYKEAFQQLDTFALLAPNDNRAIEFKSNTDYISGLINQTRLFDVTETSINDKDQSNFGSFLTNENILYFASTRSTAKKTDKWTNQPYLDIFKVTRSENGTLSEPVAVDELNTPFHDGPVTISADGNTMYFSRDGHSEKQYQKTKSGTIKIGQQGLYKASRNGDKWTNVKALPINSTTYSVTNPSLSLDGQTLYFASNMPGGIGESDIWKIIINGDNYGKPENLGAKINSAGKENFPFISEENILYFASTGKQGFGGLDLFKINLNSTEDAQNIGKPVNSEKDDFAFSFNKKANVGYFSSNRNGSDAIYTASPLCKSQIIIVVTNKKTGEIITNASVAKTDLKGNTIENKLSDKEGKATFTIDCNMSYNLHITASNFESNTISIEKSIAQEIIVPAQLIPAEAIITDKEVILKNVYFDFNRSNITSQGANELDKLVTVMKDYSSMVIFVKSHTDSKGKSAYNLNLSEQRAQSTVQYLISKGVSKDRISGKGVGSTEPKINCLENCNEEEHAQNRRSEFLIVKK